MSEQEQTPEIDYEAEARAQGWVPEEEFKGANPPKEFIDAKTFVERGDEIAGKLKSKVTRLESQLEQVMQTSAEFREFSQKQMDKDRKEREAAIAELQKIRAQAVEEGDGAKFTKADEDIDRLRSEASVEPVRQDPLVDQWLSENDWYKKDETMAAFADGVSERIVKQGYQGQAYFNELTRRTKEAFPDKFNTGPKPPTVESGQGSEASPPKERSYEALPSDAKAMCEKFIRDIPGYTKEQYIANYDWD